MRCSVALSLFSLCCAQSVHAQYFSQGWQPGQEAPPPDQAGAGTGGSYEAQEQPSRPPPSRKAYYSPPPPEGTPLSSLKDLIDVNKVLKSPTSVGLFKSFGINITERVDAAMKERESPWDQRIPLITDLNYEEMIVNEDLSEEEEKDRVWALVISSTTGQQQAGGISKFIDEQFDKEYNETMIQKDLPNVRWGRIDYLNVTYITTKWSVWQAPTLVVLQDRGQTLHFYKPNQLRIRDGALREFLKNEYWKRTPKWQSSFAPGGSNEYIMEFFAVWSTKIYLQTERVPRWIFYILSGSLASFVLGLLHRGDKAKTQKQALIKAQIAEEERKKKVAEEEAKALKESQEKKGSKGRSGGAKLKKLRK